MEGGRLRCLNNTNRSLMKEGEEKAEEEKTRFGEIKGGNNEAGSEIAAFTMQRKEDRTNGATLLSIGN